MHNDGPLRGVNIGGWLVLEPWITPTLFQGTQAADEYTFSGTPNALEKITNHRDTYITKQDLEWLHSIGIDFVRLPIGHWIFGNFLQYFGFDSYVSWFLDEAHSLQMKVLLDIHTAPGSQNGWDHSGRKGPMRWHTSKENIYQSIQILHQVTEKYSHHPALWGVEVLNEPRWDVPSRILEEYYFQAYSVIRQYSDSVAIIFHDAFRPNEWLPFFEALAGENVYLDLHHYQCFDMRDKHLTINGHVDKLQNQVLPLIEKIQRYVPVLVGEWSLGLDRVSIRGFNEEEVLRTYASVQLQAYSQAFGWCFWTYKTEDMPGWSLRSAIENKWLILTI